MMLGPPIFAAAEDIYLVLVYIITSTVMFVYIGGQVTFTAVTNIRGGDDTFLDDPITIIQQMSHHEYEQCCA